MNVFDDPWWEMNWKMKVALLPVDELVPWKQIISRQKKALETAFSHTLQVRLTLYDDGMIQLCRRPVFVPYKTSKANTIFGVFSRA